MSTEPGTRSEDADWLVGLTTTYRARGFELAVLYLRNVKQFAWDYKRVHRARAPSACTERVYRAYKLFRHL